ncbi:MAG: CBS domain-containing protein [Planctomycetota bacterium]|nr:MAG: CBS domain-containing protein [Planctomycetota bacterium]
MLKPSDLDAATLMTSEVVHLAADLPLSKACRSLLDRGLSGAPVLDGAELVGEVDLALLLEATREGRPDTTPVGALAHPPATCAPDVPLFEACRQMVRARAHRLLVVGGGRVVGILAAIDVVRALAALDPTRLRWNPLTQTVEPAGE